MSKINSLPQTEELILVLKLKLSDVKAISKDIHCRQILAMLLGDALQKKINSSTLECTDAYGVGRCKNFFLLIKNIHVAVTTCASKFELTDLQFETVRECNVILFSGSIVHRTKNQN